MTAATLVLAAALLVGCGDDDGATDGGGADAARADGGGGLLDGGDGTDSGADGGGGLLDGGDGTDAGPGPARDRLMYVSVGGERRLAVVQLAADGNMTEMAGMSVGLPANPGALSYARATRRLYVGVGSEVATLELDGSGRPSLLGTTPGTGRPVYVSVAHDELVMITAYFGADELKAHDVSGMPPHRELTTVRTAEEPHAALIGPTGGLVYVPHRNGQTTDWFAVGRDGSLSREGGLGAMSGAGPRHIIFSPDARFAWVINEFADSVSSHRVMGDGSLERFETLSTLPGGVDGRSNTCADVHVTPDGRFVYGSNRGHDSIAMFAVAGDGSLTSMGTTSTEARPRELDVSPDGRFVVVAGQDSGFLQSYRVEADGMLTSVDRLDVGNDLRWVAID